MRLFPAQMGCSEVIRGGMGTLQAERMGCCSSVGSVEWKFRASTHHQFPTPLVYLGLRSVAKCLGKS
jgi:hypothetical protein